MVRRERDTKNISEIMKLLLIFLSLFSIACSHKSSTVHWGREELKEMSKKMVQEILKSPPMELSKKRVYYFGNIRNDSHDQINTKALAQKITHALTKSKNFTFTNDKNSPYDYIFKGKISSIFKKNQQSKEMFFNFNLILIEQKSSSIVWSHSVEIRKFYTRPLLDW